MIRGFVAEGRTVLLSSHLLDEVERICDHVAIVDRGRVVTQGTIAELARDGEEAIADRHQRRRGGARDRLLPSRGRHDRPRDAGIRITLLPDVDGDAAADDIGRRLVEGGVAIRRFERARATLEERFLEVTS